MEKLGPYRTNCMLKKKLKKDVESQLLHELMQREWKLKTHSSISSGTKKWFFAFISMAT
jgi:hypothetical protein